MNAVVSKKTGLVVKDHLACVKGVGVCEIRLSETAGFTCFQQAYSCIFRVVQPPKQARLGGS